MRKLPFLISLLGLFSLSVLFVSPLIAQGNGGKNPEFVLYKHYYGPSGAIPVSDIGDSIGTIRFKAMTAPAVSVQGASIQSIISGPFNSTHLPASLIFRTGDNGQRNRMIITHQGLVGIGTDVPQFDLHTVGNTHTTGDFYGRIHFDANEATDDAPDTYIDEAYFELKQRAVLNLPAGMGTHGGLLSLAPGATSNDHQLFFGDDGIFHRRWAGNAPSWAGSTWYKLLTGEDIMGTPNRIAKFTGPSSLGDSRLFDDGTQVGIGTTTPAAGFFLDVAGATRINGNARTTGNLTVNGTAHVDAIVTIGTNNTPAALGPINTAGYRLFVQGGVLADEVLVRTGWADHVFAPEYHLRDLDEVKRHIAEKGHLPDTPPAAEIEQNGLKLAECAVNQQIKIEELFLYLIDLKEEVNALQAENARLQARIRQLEQK